MSEPEMPAERTPVCPRAMDAPACAQGTLPATAAADFEQHAAACPECARSLAAARSVISALRTVPERGCAPDLTSRIMAAIPDSAWRQPRQQGPGLVLHRLARAAALVILLAGAVAVSFFMLRNRAQNPAAPLAAARPAASLNEVKTDALAWLQQSQAADGGWSAGARGLADGYSVGVSALALLALMGDDPGALRGGYEASIRRGVDHLIARQDRNGLFGSEFPGAPYNQGLATVALLEALSREDNPAWREAATRALAYLSSIQQPSGGWTYLRSAEAPPNSSISVWPLVALARARELGFAGSAPAFERGLAWLRTTVGSGGMVGYQRAGDSQYPPGTLTAAVTLCLLKGKRGAADQQAVQAMLPVIRGTAATAEPSDDFYRAFFVSEALALAGDESSSDMRAGLLRRLAAHRDVAGPAAGSWDARDQWGSVGGRVYATALAAMSIRNG